jgi:hypothetical protein
MILPLAACGGDEGSKPDEWAGPPRPAAGGNLDSAAAAFNRYLDDHPEVAAAPALAAGRFVRVEQTTSGTTSIVAKAGAEGGGPATITVTFDGLLDDSVRTQRFVLVMRQEGDEWRLDSAAVTQRCRPGRGHEAFSPEPCV